MKNKKIIILLLFISGITQAQNYDREKPRFVMKTKYLLLIALFCILRVEGQEHKIMIYPTSLLDKELLLDYEFIPESGRMGYGFNVSGFLNATKERYSGAIVAPYIKVYFRATEKSNAWYFKTLLYLGGVHAASETYSSMQLSSGGPVYANAAVSFGTVGLGALFGKQWKFSNGLSLDLNFGFRYVPRIGIPQTVDMEYRGQSYEFSLSRFDPMWHICKWGLLGPGRFFDLQFGIGYTLPTKK